jgi:hypothetical protein
MGERGEVAARADRATRRDDGKHSSLEAGEQELDRLDPRARVPLRERVRTQEHRCADDVVGVGLAHAAGVAAEEPELQLLDLILGDRLRDESAEARVDAVGVIAAERLQERTRSDHARPRGIGQRRASSFDCDLPDVVDGEVVAGQRHRACHAASLDAAEPRHRAAGFSATARQRRAQRGPPRGREAPYRNDAGEMRTHG